ncbi:MAG: alkaline phosphatase family protein [Thermoplasmata archaeon]
MVNFTITQNTSGDTGPFDVAPSDTLVVFVELFGKTTVNNVTIENGPNDTFVQEAYLLDYVNGGTHGFSVWACANVDGGPSTDVNVTLTGGTTDSAAIEVVDVNGGNPYGGNPIPFVDQVADITKGISKTPNEGLTVHADDVALLGIGTWSWNNVTTSAPRQVLDQLTTNSTVSGTNVTSAVISYSNDNATSEAITMNGTLSASAPWIVDIITIGAIDYTATYQVSFTETGLSTGTMWCQDLQGEGSTQCETAGSGSTWDLQNGIYVWNISVEGSGVYDVSPESSGLVTVQGANVWLNSTFSDPSGTHFIQHVVVIVLENEAASYVSAEGAYENTLASTYEGSSQFFAACHPSAPEYMAIIAADTNSCQNPGSGIGDAYPTSGGGTYHSYKEETIGDTLTASGFTWANYAENLPGGGVACTDPSKWAVPGNSSLFAGKHVPFLYMDSTVDVKSTCESHILSLEPGPGISNAFNTSVVDNEMVNFSFISPNLCDDGHDGCNGVWPNATCLKTNCGGTYDDVQEVKDQADLWLKLFLTPLLACTGSQYDKNSNVQSICKTEIKHTAIFVLYDETGGENPAGKSGKSDLGFQVTEPTNQNYVSCHPRAGNPSVCGGQIYEVTIIHNSAYAGTSTGATAYKTMNSDYGITATIEWLFGLSHFCSVEPSGFSNPGCLDQYYPAMTSDFGFTNNGY